MRERGAAREERASLGPPTTEERDSGGGLASPKSPRPGRGRALVQNPPPSAGWPAAPLPVRGGKPGLPRRRPPLQPGRAPKDPPRPAAPFFSRSRVGQAGPSGGASGRVRAPARTTHPLPRQLEVYPSLPRGRGGWARRRDAGAGPGAKAPRGACRGKLGGCCSLCERAHPPRCPAGPATTPSLHMCATGRPAHTARSSLPQKRKGHTRTVSQATAHSDDDPSAHVSLASSMAASSGVLGSARTTTRATVRRAGRTPVMAGRGAAARRENMAEREVDGRQEGERKESVENGSGRRPPFLFLFVRSLALLPARGGGGHSLSARPQWRSGTPVTRAGWWRTAPRTARTSTGGTGEWTREVGLRLRAPNLPPLQWPRAASAPSLPRPPQLTSPSPSPPLSLFQARKERAGLEP